MALAPTLRIAILQARFPIVDPKTGIPTSDFIDALNKAFQNTETVVNNQGDLLAAIASANAAAAAANTAAATAQTAAEDVTASSSLANSGTSGLSLTATDAGASATIAISGHTRNYGDGTSVAVAGGSLTGLGYSTDYYVHYVQPSRAGGAVTYLASTNPDDLLQIGDNHSIGAITTPAAAGSPNDGLAWIGPGGIDLR
jgi:hypothetical protein